MPDAYLHQVFISYSHADACWARRLEADLVSHGVSVFRDESRLTAGVPWEPQLAATAPRSQHLVVLWSRTAQASDWVREETIRFKAAIDPNGSGPLSTERRLFQILLDTTPSPTLNRYHAFTSLQSANIAAGPDEMTPEQRQCWKAIVADIAEAANPPLPSQPWPVAVFAGVKATFQGNQPAPPQGFEGTFEEFLPTIGVPTLEAFESQYGDSVPQQWKPFGSTESVQDMLGDHLAIVNRELHRVNPTMLPMRWQYVDLITTAASRMDDEVQKLATGPALLLIDPLSLGVIDLMRRYGRLAPCFENAHATILWLTPFEPYKPSVTIRSLVQQAAYPLIRGYYEPLPRRPPFRCAVNVADAMEVGRMLLGAAADLPTPPAPKPQSAILGYAEARS